MSSFLDSKCESVGEGIPLLCPKSPWWIVRDDDPTVRFPTGCMAYRCVVCGPRKVRERVKLMQFGIALASWSTFWTLTQLPETWQDARGKMKDFIRRMRKNNKLELAWSIERNPENTGFHAHALQWGDYISLDEVYQRWGNKWVHLSPIKRDAASYSTKCYRVAGYSCKVASEHLDLNGGRCVHMTRGYLHGLNAREALKAMSKGHKWHIEPATIQEAQQTRKDDYHGTDSQGQSPQMEMQGMSRTIQDLPENPSSNLRDVHTRGGSGVGILATNRSGPNSVSMQKLSRGQIVCEGDGN